MWEKSIWYHVKKVQRKIEKAIETLIKHSPVPLQWQFDKSRAGVFHVYFHFLFNKESTSVDSSL